MSTVRQKQVYDGHTGVTHYEITFTALAHDWIPAETYEEISDSIDIRINDPEAFAAQTAYDALTGMMATWKMKAHEADVVWRGGFKAAWLAAGGVLSDLN
jgi:hypothetical protein